jgi:hypothetical protein
MEDLMAKPDSEKVEAALVAADEPLTIDKICDKVFGRGRAGQRERGLVYVVLHRMIERGVAEKHEATYEYVGKKKTLRRVSVRG